MADLRGRHQDKCPPPMRMIINFCNFNLFLARSVMIYVHIPYIYICIYILLMWVYFNIYSLLVYNDNLEYPLLEKFLDPPLTEKPLMALRHIFWMGSRRWITLDIDALCTWTPHSSFDCMSPVYSRWCFSVSPPLQVGDMLYQINRRGTFPLR